MANLIEDPAWAEGIYQLEEEDLVKGGVDGIDNLQAKQLANRTAYLKSMVEGLGENKQDADVVLAALAALVGAADKLAYFTGANSAALTSFTAFARTLLAVADAGDARALIGAATPADIGVAIAALVNSSPAALDTLNEFATALGNDANFATTITNAMALKAALVSPPFSGNPTAPTPAQFDNDTSLATTAFVQRALGNSQGASPYAANATLTAAQAGQTTIAYGGSFTLTLPLLSSVQNGAAFEFLSICTAASVVTIAAQGPDVLVGSVTPGTASIALLPGDTLKVMRTDSGTWSVIGGSAQLKFSGGAFGASLVSSGYQKLPSGMIIQWGSAVSNGAGQATFTFPIAFPSALLAVVPTLNTDAATPYVTYALPSTWSKASVAAFVCNSAGTGQTGQPIFFVAFGK